MKTLPTKSCLGALLLIGSSAGAQSPAILSDAIQALRQASNFTWTTTTELPGAPFQVPPVTGRMATNGLVVLVTESGKRMAVVQGGTRVLKGESGWKPVAPGRAKEPAYLDLLGALAPADELAALSAQLTGVTREHDGSITGTLGTPAAKAWLQSSMAGRTPAGRTPEIEAAVGQLHLWLKDGLPQKYTLTIHAGLSLPFGTKEVTRISTTEIRDLGSTAVEIPAEARQALEKQR